MLKRPPPKKRDTARLGFGSVRTREPAPQGRDAIAVAIRRARQTVALTQAEFARQLGRMRGEKPHQAATIGSWERGESVPDALDLLNAARLADVPITWLFGGADFAERLARVERKIEQITRLLEQRGIR